MKLDELTAYCGVDCRACPDHINKKCPSCKKTQWKDGDICMPVKCCLGRGVEFCGQCETFPCNDMAEFYRESPSHEAAFNAMRALKQ